MAHLTYLRDIIASEGSFVETLKSFNETIIKSLALKNSVFKREFLGHSSFALCMNLLIDILDASTSFADGLRKVEASGGGPDDIARGVSSSYMSFSHNILLYAQYVSEISSALFVLQKFEKPLSEFLNTCEPLVYNHS